MKNVVLIGYMGCGKSSVGKELAQKNQMTYLDLDDYIEEKEQLKIADIFTQKGEVYFRRKESEYLAECIENAKNNVISLGGGTPCFGNNMEIIKNSDKLTAVYLQTSIPKLTERLFSEKDKRPLISHAQTSEELQEFIAKHLFERIAFYTQANEVVSTDTKSVAEIVAVIQDLLQEKSN